MTATDRRPAPTEPVRAVFLGSGTFAVPVVDALAGHPAVGLVAIVTAPPRPRGRDRELRPTPVGEWAANRGLPVLAPARLRHPDSMAELAATRPGIIVLADYGRLVPSEILALPPHGALNLHPSLLPRHRGAAPIQAAIVAGDEETGVSLMRMDAGLDTGPIVAQRRHRLSGRETAPELEATLATEAARLLRENLEPWLEGALEPVPQPADGATLTRPLSRDDGRLDPAQPAAALERQVRAYQPWPGSFLETDSGRIAIWQAAAHPGRAADGARGTPATDAAAGKLVAVPGEGPGGRLLGLTTVDGWLELVEVQPAGGRRMSGRDLLRGRPSLAGVQVGASSAAASRQGR